MEYAALISQLLGSVAGQAASQMDKDSLMALIKGVTDDFGKIDLPKLKELVLNPQANTQLAGIRDDQTYRGQQNAADAQLNDVINSGGLTIADRAALNQIRARTARTESAGRHAIEGGMAARGTLDSGNTLAMELNNNQQSAQSLSQAGEDTAGKAQARALEAIRERARNAGAGLDRDYRQKSDAARAQDAINAGNTAIANTAAKYNAGIPQQNFGNAIQLASAKAQPAYALAGAKGANAKDTQQFYQGLGNTAAAGFNKLGSSNTGSSDSNDYASRGSPSDLSGGSTDALSGETTRPARVKEIVGYDDEGRPIWGYRSQT